MKKLFTFLPFLLACFNLFALKPEKKYIATPETYQFKFQQEKIKTSDGIGINVWNIEPVGEKKGKTIVVCGTDAGNMSYLLYYVLPLSQEGYQVILFDYRGFGESDDFKIDSTMLFYPEFLQDFETVVNYAQNKYSTNKIGTMGFSMGGYFPFITTKKLDFIIADSPLVKPSEFLKRFTKKEKTVKVPQNAIDGVIKNIPTLVFIGNTDSLVKEEDFKKNTKHFVQLITYEGGHLEAATLMKDSYFNTIKAFLERI